MALRHTRSYAQYKGEDLVTGPGSEPVTKADVKDQLRISGTDEDDLLDLYIESARLQVEQSLSIALIDQTWKLALDRWPHQSKDQWWNGVREMAVSELYNGKPAPVILPRWPLASVDSITVDGSSITIGDFFETDTIRQQGRLVLKIGKTWPTITDTRANAVVIQYTAGYGANASDVPADIRLAIIQTVAYMYKHRGDCSAESALKDSGAFDLLHRYRKRRV